MENNRFFLMVQRINSLAFLLVLLGIVLLIVSELVTSRRWRHNEEVIVTEQNGAVQRDLLVGNLSSVTGHATQILTLESRERGGKFSSGGYGTNTRNLLFLNGAEMRANWLFKGNGQLIRSHRLLTGGGDDEEEGCDARNPPQPVLAIYYEVVHGSGNDDRWLDDDLPWSIALSRPDGSGYREIEQGVRSVVQQRVVDDGATLMLLVQEGPRLVMKRYSLQSFDKISEKEIATLAKVEE